MQAKCAVLHSMPTIISAAVPTNSQMHDDNQALSAYEEMVAGLAPGMVS
jgi:hypothetical protein